MLESNKSLKSGILVVMGCEMTPALGMAMNTRFLAGGLGPVDAHLASRQLHSLNLMGIRKSNVDARMNYTEIFKLHSGLEKLDRKITEFGARRGLVPAGIHSSATLEEINANMKDRHSKLNERATEAGRLKKEADKLKTQILKAALLKLGVTDERKNEAMRLLPLNDTGTHALIYSLRKHNPMYDDYTKARKEIEELIKDGDADTKLLWALFEKAETTCNDASSQGLSTALAIGKLMNEQIARDCGGR